MRTIVTAIAAAGFLTACGGRRVQLDNQIVVSHPDVIEITARWVKDKHTKFDILFTISNLSEQTLIIKRRHLVCARGGVTGRLYKIDEPIIELFPGEDRELLGLCETGLVDGPFSIELTKVYGPDGEIVVLEGFVWSIDSFGALSDNADQGRRAGMVREKTAPRPVMRQRPKPEPKRVVAPPPVKPAPPPVAVPEHSLEPGASQMAVKRYLIGRELYLQGNLEGAAAEFQGAFDIFPQSPKLAFNLARCHERMGHTSKAIDFYEKYLVLAPAGAVDRGDIEKLLSAMKKRGS